MKRNTAPNTPPIIVEMALQEKEEDASQYAPPNVA